MRESKVLDHGYVKLVDYMGTDNTPALAARVSYGDGTKGFEQDMKLTSYLWSHEHMSPFEMVELVWEVKAPIFVARQWMRHRAASYNEFSMRYADPSKLSESDEIEFYTPSRWRVQAEKNKQQSELTEPFVNPITDKYSVYVNLMVAYYRAMLDNGVAREQARMVLPTSVYTKFIYKVDFRNMLGFLSLRMSEDAQWEIRQYAQRMYGILAKEFPFLIEVVDKGEE